ncbi:MAG: gamma-glutamyltransferase family protein [Candidatus Dormibacteraeota bacterium]|nr:gamma-glutamyltransferase family protein [Candidatus Dormibacteraeota bacterium]
MSEPAFTTRPELQGTFGMVASTHWLASASGMAVLEKGGNAFDAAVAAGFVLQVVEPHLNGPGGDMPAILYDTRRRETVVLCGQGPAPAAASTETFNRLGLDMVPGTGLLAACVPGATSAWLRMLAEFGSLGLGDVLEYAIAYAENGYPLVWRISDAIAKVESLFRQEWPESARIYLQGGVPQPGTLFRNRDLAATYRGLLDAAKAAGRGRETQIEAAMRSWHEGFVAEAIDTYCRSAEVLDVSGRRHSGLLTGHDLAGWRPSVEAAVSYDYRDWRVFKCGPWSQGPVFLQQLSLLAGFDLAGMDPSGADFMHTVVECANLAFSDREAWYGDPLFTPDRVPALLEPGYAAARRALVGTTASSDLRPGSPAGRSPRLPDYGEVPADEDVSGLGDPTTGPAGVVRGDTCHVDVADRLGNMVSATPSGGWLQSSPVIPGLGFALGTRAQIFTLQPGLPNSLEPGKRPRTTLSPSLAHRDGGARLAFGTPGADQQDQWSLTFFVRLVDHAGTLQEHIDAPMFHTDSFPRSFYPHHRFPGRLVVEGGVAPETLAELRRRGYDVQVSEPWTLGRLSAVAGDAKVGLLRAAANARSMQGYAVGR